MCTSPIFAFMPKLPDIEGKYNLLFHMPHYKKLNQFTQIETPCNKCIACESLRSLKTAVQLHCELKMTEINNQDSWFLNPTYNDEHLPLNGSVNLKHAQLFNKAIRNFRVKQYKSDCKKSCNDCKTVCKNISRLTKYRNLYQFEYGGITNRAHGHVTAFNLSIPDLIEVESKGNYKAYESETITKLWGKGNLKILNVTIGSCIYIASHHFQDKLGKSSKIHKTPYIHPVTGKLVKSRSPEFSNRSNRPGIGKEFYKKFKSDIYPHDFIIIDGQKYPVPNYFDDLLKEDDPILYEEVKRNRVIDIKQKTAKENAYQALFNLANIKTKKFLAT